MKFRKMNRMRPGFAEQHPASHIGATVQRRAPDARPAVFRLQAFARSVRAREFQIVTRRDMAMHHLRSDVVMRPDSDTQAA
jgi:hypothetical protein